MPSEQIRLTEYSHGAGCGCKIAPGVLETILASSRTFAPDPHLLVGNSSKDDAAAYDIGDGQVILSTTDFFMPIVDEPFDFGRIAATNAISDIYNTVHGHSHPGLADRAPATRSGPRSGGRRTSGLR